MDMIEIEATVFTNNPLENVSHEPCSEGFDEPTDEFGSKLSRDLVIYISPFVLVIGLLGNIMTLVVMSRQSLRDSSTTIYLRCNAVLDTIVLYFGLLIRWVRSITDIDLKVSSTWMCKMTTFVVY